MQTMVRRCLDQKIRAQRFEARNEMKQEYQRKAQGNQSTLKGCKELSKEAKGQCARGDACTFCHDEKKRGKSTHSSSPAPEPITWENFFEGKISERPESVWEEISKTVRRLHQWETHEALV